MTPQDIYNRVTGGGIEPAKSQKTVFRAKAEPPFTTNMFIDARRRGKEGPVGKKARARSYQTISGHPRPVKTEKSKHGSAEQRGSQDGGGPYQVSGQLKLYRNDTRLFLLSD